MRYIKKHTSRYVNAPKSYLWNVTYKGRTVQKWAVTAQGARSQSMSDFNVLTLRGIVARRVQVKANE